MSPRTCRDPGCVQARGIESEHRRPVRYGESLYASDGLSILTILRMMVYGTAVSTDAAPTSPRHPGSAKVSALRTGLSRVHNPVIKSIKA